jgi:hypothetical protein
LIQHFRMNALTTVQAVEERLWRVTARSEDDLFAAEVRLEIKLPSLEIRSAVLDIPRDELGMAPDLTAARENLIGVRVGPGMTKIVRAVVGGENGSDRMAELVLEAMEMLINALTVPELRKATETDSATVDYEKEGPKIRLNDPVIGEAQVRVMAENPRLKDSCAAFRGL